MSLNVMQATFGYHPQEGTQTPKSSFKKFPHLISTPLMHYIYKIEDEKKLKTCWFGSTKWFCPIICAPDVEACKSCKNKA
jgi:hypothetical protein